MSDPRKVWTAAEREYLRRHYGPRAPERLPCVEIASRLGATARAVHEAARRFGLQSPRPRRPWLDRRVRLLHARGWSVYAIARRLGVAYGTAWDAHRRLGLSPAGWSPMTRAAQASRCRRTATEHCGTPSAGDWQALRRRARAAALGWPQVPCETAARLLCRLHEGPPATRRELAEALQASQKAIDVWLGRVIRLGLVVRSPRPNPGRRPLAEYRLAPGVGPHVPGRERGEGPLPRHTDSPRTAREPRVCRVAGGRG